MHKVVMHKVAIAMAALTTAALAQSAGAGEYCVVCAGPEATYRCQVEGAATVGQDTDPRLQLLCISQLAKAGKHDNCSINRKATDPDAGETCAGKLRIIAAPTSPPPGATPAGNAVEAPDLPQPKPDTAYADPAHEASPDDAHAEKVPQTMEELAGPTVKENLQKAGDAIGGTGNAIAGGAKQAGETIGDAGSAVGNAAKSTWNCLTSLFSDCGDGAATP